MQTRIRVMTGLGTVALAVLAMLSLTGAGSAGSTLPQLKTIIVQNQDAGTVAPGSFFNEKAICPVGYKVTGGGYNISPAVGQVNGNVEITSSFPATLSGRVPIAWVLVGWNPTSGDMTLPTVLADCARIQ